MSGVRVASSFFASLWQPKQIFAGSKEVKCQKRASRPSIISRFSLGAGKLPLLLQEENRSISLEASGPCEIV